MRGSRCTRKTWKSPTYIKRYWEKDGQREALRETLVGFLNARYPMLVDLAREQISGITEIKQLQEIVNKLFYLQTAGEIEEYLLSLHHAKTF